MSICPWVRRRPPHGLGHCIHTPAPSGSRTDAGRDPRPGDGYGATTHRQQQPYRDGHPRAPSLPSSDGQAVQHPVPQPPVWPGAAMAASPMPSRIRAASRPRDASPPAISPRQPARMQRLSLLVGSSRTGARTRTARHSPSTRPPTACGWAPGQRALGAGRAACSGIRAPVCTVVNGRRRWRRPRECASSGSVRPACSAGHFRV